MPSPAARAGGISYDRVEITGARVALGLLLFAGVWLLVLRFTTCAAPADNIEQLNWVRSLQWGYYKHPPLPTWLLAGPVWLLGLSPQITYVLGATCTLGSMALLWRFLRRVRGPHYATLALLAALCITYYNGRLQFYNHNVVLLLATTCAALLTHAAMTRTGVRWWIGLGLALGLGALAKYQMAVTGLCVLAFWISQRGWANPQKRAGLAVALVVALLVTLPHLHWLTMHDYGPIHYAMASSLGENLGAGARVATSITWLADQLLNRALPAWILLILVAAPWRGKREESADVPADRQLDAAGALLLCWGSIPLAFMFLLGITTGADLQAQWGTAFLLFCVPAAMEFFRWTEPRAERQARFAWGVFGAVQILLIALNVLTSPTGPTHWRSHQWESFGAAKLARELAPSARLALGGPIRVVVGERAHAGAFSLEIPEHPLVLLDGNYASSPWVPPDLVARCGALRIGQKSELPQGRPIGPAFPNLAWTIIAPEPGAAPCA